MSWAVASTWPSGGRRTTSRQPLASVALNVRFEWPPAISSKVNGGADPATWSASQAPDPSLVDARQHGGDGSRLARRRTQNRPRSEPYDALVAPPIEADSHVLRGARPRRRLQRPYLVRAEAASGPVGGLLLAVPPQPALRRTAPTGRGRSAERGRPSPRGGGGRPTASRIAGDGPWPRGWPSRPPIRRSSATSASSSSSSAARPGAKSAGRWPPSSTRPTWSGWPSTRHFASRLRTWPRHGRWRRSRWGFASNIWPSTSGPSSSLPSESRPPARGQEVRHSHSIVPGGFDVTS